MNKKILTIITIGMILALLLTACGSGALRRQSSGNTNSNSSPSLQSQPGSAEIDSTASQIDSDLNSLDSSLKTQDTVDDLGK